MNTLTKKYVPFVRTEARTEAFDKLKRALVLTPFLAYPNFGEPFLFLSTLAPLVLVLPHQKSNYSTTEREALALVEGIKIFQPYLHNHKLLLLPIIALFVD